MLIENDLLLSKRNSYKWEDNCFFTASVTHWGDILDIHPLRIVHD